MDFNAEESETFQQQVFEIREPSGDFDPTAEPRNGEEFLTKMLFERKQCPTIVVRRPKMCSEAQERSATEIASSLEKEKIPPLKHLPTKEWKLVQIEDFEGVRNRITLLRREMNTSKYNNELEPPLSTNADEWKQFCREHQPLLSIVMRFNQSTLEQLLEYICEWMQSDNETLPEQEASRENVFSSAPIPCTLDLLHNAHWLGPWLYATLACLHLPLKPEVHSTLRDIARVCLSLRGRLSPIEMEKASPYNLFICLIAKVFGQLDFVEFV